MKTPILKLQRTHQYRSGAMDDSVLYTEKFFTIENDVTVHDLFFYCKSKYKIDNMAIGTCRFYWKIEEIPNEILEKKPKAVNITSSVYGSKMIPYFKIKTIIVPDEQ